MKNKVSSGILNLVLVPIILAIAIMAGYVYLGTRGSVRFSAEASNFTLFLIPFFLWSWLLAVWHSGKLGGLSNLFALCMIPGFLFGAQYIFMFNLAEKTSQALMESFTLGFLSAILYIGALCGLATGALGLLAHCVFTLIGKHSAFRTGR